MLTRALKGLVPRPMQTVDMCLRNRKSLNLNWMCCVLLTYPQDLQESGCLLHLATSKNCIRIVSSQSGPPFLHVCHCMPYMGLVGTATARLNFQECPDGSARSGLHIFLNNMFQDRIRKHYASKQCRCRFHVARFVSQNESLKDCGPTCISKRYLLDMHEK